MSRAAQSARERNEVLDVLRGFALWGVFLVNLTVSARPFEEAIGPPSDGALDRITWALVDGLAVGKFFLIFSLLFGIGLVMQTDRLRHRSGTPGRIYARRLGILAALGLVHGLLLFEGDILFPYAVAGAILYAFRTKSARTLLVLAAIPLAIGLVASGTVEMLDASEWMDAEELDRQAEHAHHGGSWTDTLAFRAQEYVGWLIVATLTSFHWRMLAMFFVGAAVARRGLLAREHARKHGRVALIALPIGLLAELGGNWLSLRLGEDAPSLTLALASAVSSLVLSAGLVAGTAWIVHTGRWARPRHALAAMGRMALTGYLTQSVFMNVLFYWYGLDLWSAIPRAGIVAIACGGFALQVLFSVFWLRWFSMGPCEWWWRRWTYGRRSSFESAGPSR